MPSECDFGDDGRRNVEMAVATSGRRETTKRMMFRVTRWEDFFQYSVRM